VPSASGDGEGHRTDVRLADAEAEGRAVTDPAPPSGTAADRRAWILSTIRTVGFLSVTELARRLGVSQMTIRRDLHSLEETGAVRLVHGGASLLPGALENGTFPDDEHAAARGRVAQRAVDLVEEAETIALDAGAIGLAMARALPAAFAGCVVTHSLPVLQLLASRGHRRVVALGGELLPDRQAFTGPMTEAAVADLRVRRFFLSPGAVDARGVYAHSQGEAGVQRRLMDIADEVVLVAIEEAFTTSAPALVAPLDRVAAVVCDRRPPAELACALRRAGVVSHVVGG
jgi:DeoR/GlpR family transcriptional regulator of sugar metabolism